MLWFFIPEPATSFPNNIFFEEMSFFLLSSSAKNIKANLHYIIHEKTTTCISLSLSKQTVSPVSR